MAIRVTKALAGGGYAGPRLSLVLVYKPKWQQMATAITITCWSAVWQLGPILLL
jgi:hypothetical protein